MVWFSPCGKELNHHLSQRKVDTEGMPKAKPSLIDRAYSDLRDSVLLSTGPLGRARAFLLTAKKRGPRSHFGAMEVKMCHIGEKGSTTSQLKTLGLKMLFYYAVLEIVCGHWYDHKTRTKVDFSEESRFHWGEEFLTVWCINQTSEWCLWTSRWRQVYIYSIYLW